MCEQTVLECLNSRHCRAGRGAEQTVVHWDQLLGQIFCCAESMDDLSLLSGDICSVLQRSPFRISPKGKLDTAFGILPPIQRSERNNQTLFALWFHFSFLKMAILPGLWGLFQPQFRFSTIILIENYGVCRKYSKFGRLLKRQPYVLYRVLLYCDDFFDRTQQSPRGSYSASYMLLLAFPMEWRAFVIHLNHLTHDTRRVYKPGSSCNNRRHHSWASWRIRVFWQQWRREPCFCWCMWISGKPYCFFWGAACHETYRSCSTPTVLLGTT